jgi:serine/threonine-protein kinase
MPRGSSAAPSSATRGTPPPTSGTPSSSARAACSPSRSSRRTPRRSLGWAYYYARRYDQARQHLERAIAMNPNAEETFRVLGLSLSIEGRHAEAIQVLEEAVQMEGAGAYTRATLAHALARGGRRADAEATLRELLALARTEYVTPVATATVLLGLDERDAALDWMEKARADRRGWLAYLRVNPIFDALRGLPRFEAMVAELGLG